MCERTLPSLLVMFLSSYVSGHSHIRNGNLNALQNYQWKTPTDSSPHLNQNLTVSFLILHINQAIDMQLTGHLKF